MSECESLGTCPFFNDRMANMPAMKDLYKDRYCRSEFHNCARYMVLKFKGKGNVPPDLFPNNRGRAAILVSNSGDMGKSTS